MAGYIIFTLVYIAVFAACMYFAWKRAWQKSLASLAVAAVSFLGAYYLAKHFNVTVGAAVSDALKEGFLEVLNLRSDVMVRETAMLNVSAFAVNIIFGMTVFLLFFGLLYAVGSLIKRALFAAFTKKSYASYKTEKSLPILSAAIALISFGTVSFALLYPLGAASDVALNAADRCGFRIPATVLTNPISRIYGIKSREFFDSISYVSDEFVNSEEAQRGAEIYMSLKNVRHGLDDGSAAEHIAESLRDSYLLTDFGSELVANAANSWKNGRKYMNKTVKIPEGRNGELVTDVLEILSGWQRDNLIEDIDTAINVYKLLREYQITKINDGAALMKALSHEEFDRKLFLELSRNSDFIAVIPKVMHFGIGSAVDAMKLEMNDEYIVEFNAKELTEGDWINEAKAFSTLLSRMEEMGSEDGDFDVLAFLNDLYELRDSKLLSNMLLNLLIQILYNMQLSGFGF